MLGPYIAQYFAHLTFVPAFSCTTGTVLSYACIICVMAATGGVSAWARATEDRARACYSRDPRSSHRTHGLYTACLRSLADDMQRETAPLQSNLGKERRRPYWLQWDAPNSHSKLPLRSTIITPIWHTYPSTDPIYQPKRHPDSISHFATIHFPDRPTDIQTDRPAVGIGDNSIPRALTLCCIDILRHDNNNEYKQLISNTKSSFTLNAVRCFTAQHRINQTHWLSWECSHIPKRELT